MKQYLRELIKRKDLVIYLVISGLKTQNRNTYLGYFWWLLDPLFMALVYFFMVVVIFNRGGENYGVHLVIGIVVFRWMSTVISTSAKSIISRSSIIDQVYMPKALFPLGATMTQTVSFGFAMVIVALFLIAYQIYPTLYLLWLPYIILMMFFFLLALALFLGYICSFVRDIDNLLGHLNLVLRYTAPVIWEERLVPPSYQWALDYNPLTLFLRSFRNVLMHGQPPELGPITAAGLISILVILVLLYYYSLNEHKIIKVL